MHRRLGMGKDSSKDRQKNRICNLLRFSCCKVNIGNTVMSEPGRQVLMLTDAPSGQRTFVYALGQDNRLA